MPVPLNELLEALPLDMDEVVIKFQADALRYEIIARRLDNEQIERLKKFFSLYNIEFVGISTKDGDVMLVFLEYHWRAEQK